MIIEQSEHFLENLLTNQLRNLFLLDEAKEYPLIIEVFAEVLSKVEYSFSFSKNKYYKRGGEVYFNPLHTSQYGIFLYFLSSVLWRNTGNNVLCDKVYSLSKIINGFDLYYEVMMPDIFFMDHPVGTVLGRAKYGNYFQFSQNCTVGNNKGIYPIFGDSVTMHSYSRVIGSSKIGDNVIVSSGAYVKDQDVPSNCIVFGASPHLIIKNTVK